MRALVVTLTALAALGLAAAPGAQARPKARARGAERARQAAAVRQFEAGERQFAEGRYDAAAERFKAAWDLFPDPVYLFNIGVAYEHQGRWALAVEYYDRFLEAAPDSPAAPDVRRRRDAAQAGREAEQAVVALRTTPAGAAAVVSAPSGEARCTTPCEVRVDPGAVSVSLTLGDAATQLARTLGPRERWDAAATLAVGPDLLPDPGPAPDNTAAWVTWGGAALALSTSAVFGALALDGHLDLRAIARRDAPTEADVQRHARRRRDVQTASAVADVALVLGLAGAAVGWALWKDAPQAPEPAVEIGPTGALWRW